MKARMGMKYCVSLLLLCALAACHNKDKQVEEKVQAREVAEAWLSIMDSGQYGKSWDEAAKFFQRSIPRDQWEKVSTDVREPFGRVESRLLATLLYTTSLPGAPDGEYVVIQYQTSFSNKKNALETITPMKESDGRWRVSGYFIK